MSMKLLINRNVVYTIIVVVGLLFGAGLFYFFSNFESIKDGVSGLFEKAPVAQEPKDEDIPYFADADRDFLFGEEDDWLFKVFQPKVLEYYSKDGANYMKVEYIPLESDEVVQMHVLLTKDLDWIITEEIFNNIKVDDLSEITPSKIRYSPGGDLETTQGIQEVSDKDSYLNISEIKDKFKVGDRIALALPYFYPAKEARTDAYCQKAQMEKYLCNHAVIYDKLDADIKTLLMGNTVSSETVVYPFSISDDLSLNGFNRNQQNNDED